MQHLTGQNILIVGASSGIGAGLFESAVRDGANVFTAGRQPISSSGHISFDALVDSFAVPTEWPEIFHGLVYCPGTVNLKPIHRLTQQDFLTDYQINVLGFVTVLQSMLPRLKKANGSSVVVFSTVAAQIGLGFHASIAAAKGGLQAMAKSLASELAPSQVRINVIAPSLTETPLVSGLLNSPEKMEASAKRHPLQRIGQIDDVVGAALFLLQNSNGWITGQTLTIDGGLSTLK